MYSYEVARQRLWNHSNLPQGTGAPDDQSFLFALYKYETDMDPLPFELADDVIACLSAANIEYNGSIPSNNTGSRNKRVVQDLAYAVSRIIIGGLSHYRDWSRREMFTPDVRDALLDALHRIAYAWDQMLAGDIDDLTEGADAR